MPLQASGFAPGARLATRGTCERRGVRVEASEMVEDSRGDFTGPEGRTAEETDDEKQPSSKEASLTQ